MGAEGMVTKGANWHKSWNQYRRSKNAIAVTSIALTDLLGRIMLDDAVAEPRDSKDNLDAALNVAPPSPPVPGVWGTLQLRSFAFR